jgi:hypothetical protein
VRVNSRSEPPLPMRHPPREKLVTSVSPPYTGIEERDAGQLLRENGWAGNATGNISAASGVATSDISN